MDAGPTASNVQEQYPTREVIEPRSSSEDIGDRRIVSNSTKYVRVREEDRRESHDTLLPRRHDALSFDTSQDPRNASPTVTFYPTPRGQYRTSDALERVTDA
jgi:hypothetical protein